MYMVRSKSRGLKMRDVASGKMLPVTARRWVPFEVLPGGTSANGDSCVEVKHIGDDDIGKKALAVCEAENARMEAEDKVVAAARAEREKRNARTLEEKRAELESGGLKRTPEQIKAINAEARGEKPDPKKSKPLAEDPTPVEPKPDPKKSKPLAEDPTPVEPKPDPKKSKPLAEDPTPVEPKPEAPKPEPLAEDPTPVEPKPDPKKSKAKGK